MTSKSAGTPWSTGSVVSLTVTSKPPVVVSPPRSVTEQDTWLVPRGSVLPLAGVQVGTGSGASSGSVAMTPDQSAVQPFVVLPSTVKLTGRTSRGAMLPTTFIVRLIDVIDGPSARLSPLPAGWKDR